MNKSLAKMSSLYPSLEDMKVDQMMKAQQMGRPNELMSGSSSGSSSGWAPSAPYPTLQPNNDKLDALYPTLDDYMGISLTSEEKAILERQIKEANAVALPQNNTVVLGTNSMVAPISSTSLGLLRANVTHGIREVVLCKDKDSKVGMRVQAINKGVFVVFVQSGSPASMVGLRFGDQILQINNENVAGFSRDKVHDIIKKSNVNGINLVVRDRPFERVITLHKDSAGHVGFTFKNGKITAIVKDSSAARNGLLTEHNLLEVNGQNVVKMEDKLIRQIMESGGDIITLTIMPSVIFDHMMKQMASSLVKKLMDHSIPDL